MSPVRLLSGIRNAAAAFALFGLMAVSNGADAAQLDTTFDIDSSSFVAISSIRNYAPGSEFSVFADNAIGDVIPLTFTDVFFPQIDVGSGETFDVELAASMGGQFTANYDTSNGSILTEMITVQITGSGGNSGPFTFQLSTGTVSRPPCGAAAPSSASGSPVNGAGEFTLISSACIFNLNEPNEPFFPFNQVWAVRLTGEFGTQPTVMAPEPSFAALLGLGLAGLALRRRNA